MKIACISDIHGNILALEAVLADIKSKNIQKIYCTGDLVGYGTRSNEVIELILNEQIPTVRGNHDQAIAFFDENVEKEKNRAVRKWIFENLKKENLTFLQNLPNNIVLEANFKKILFVHGTNSSNKEYLYENDFEKQQYIANEISEDIIVFGHTHNIYDKKVSDKLFVNVGSVGRMKDGDNRASYTILTINDDILIENVRIDYNFEALAQEIENSPLPNEFADLIRNGK